MRSLQSPVGELKSTCHIVGPKIKNKKQTKTNKKTERDSQAQRTDFRLLMGRGHGGGMNWEFGISRCKLVYIEWINSKVVLYIQYPVINHMANEMKKNYIY